MYEELKGQSATCQTCGYTYDGSYVMHRQDVKAVLEDGACTWCSMYKDEVKVAEDSLNPVAWAAKRTLEVMGF